MKIFLEKSKEEIYVCNKFHSVTTTDETFCGSTQWCEMFMYGNVFRCSFLRAKIGSYTDAKKKLTFKLNIILVAENENS